MTKGLLARLSSDLIAQRYASGFRRDEMLFGMVRKTAEPGPERYAVLRAARA